MYNVLSFLYFECNQVNQETMGRPVNATQHSRLKEPVATTAASSMYVFRFKIPPA